MRITMTFRKAEQIWPVEPPAPHVAQAVSPALFGEEV